MTRRSAGFTLIEVIVALTVMSMISLATLSAMRTLGSTQEKLDLVSERTQEMRSVSQLLRRVLIDAQPVMRPSHRAPLSYFQGAAQEVVWVSPFSASRSIGGLTIFRLAVSDSQQLTLQFAPFVKPEFEPDWSVHDVHILVPQLDDFQVRFNASPFGDWVTDWENATQNPDRVKLSIAANDRYWPDLIIRLNDSYASSQR